MKKEIYRETVDVLFLSRSQAQTVRDMCRFCMATLEIPGCVQ
jgi:hypothetical protein